MWRFTLPETNQASGTAVLDDRWLSLSTALSADSPVQAAFRCEGAWALALWNGRLATGGKLRLAEDRSTLELVQEIWLGNGPEIAASVTAGCGFFREGVSALFEEFGPDAVDGPEEDGEPQQMALADLREMATAEDWELEERSSGDLVRNLDFGARGVFQLRLRPAPKESVRVWTEILTDQELDPSCRQALGVLLNRIHDGLRLVRGAAQSNRGRVSVRLEVVQPPPCSAERIELAFSSLAAACWACGPEIRLLAGRDVAQRYLKSFGAAQLANPA